MVSKKKKGFIEKIRSNDKEAVLQLLLSTSIVFIIIVFINIYQAESYKKVPEDKGAISSIQVKQTIESQLAGIAKIMDENGASRKVPSQSELKKISGMLKNRQINIEINPTIGESQSTAKY